MKVKSLLFEMRTSKGYSVRKLAEKSGVSKTAINNIENHKRSPSLETLKKLADALGCRIEDLYIDK